MDKKYRNKGVVHNIKTTKVVILLMCVSRVTHDVMGMI